MQYQWLGFVVICYNVNRKLKKMSYLNLQKINRLVDQVLVKNQLFSTYINIALQYKFNIIQTPQEIQKLANNINNRMTKNANSDKNMNKQQQNPSNYWVLGQYKLFKTVLALYSIYNSISISSFNEKNILELQEIFHKKSPIIIEYQLASLTRKPKKWSEEENKLLTAIIKTYQQPSWKHIVIDLFRLSSKKYFREFAQCREHWNSRLSPNIKKQKWNLQEDVKLLKLIQANGFKWSLISKKMSGQRSQHTVKNRYNCLAKKLSKNNKDYQSSLIEQLIIKLQSKRVQFEQNSQSSQLKTNNAQKQEESMTELPSEQKNISLDPLNIAIANQFPIEIYLNFGFNESC